MKPINWRRHHKICGIAAALFLLLFCVSGFVLNHRSMYARIDVGRQWLPTMYRYDNWNMGLIRGCTAQGPYLFWYGDGGIFTAECDEIEEFNTGLPPYSDYRHIRNVVVQSHFSDYGMQSHRAYAVGQYGLYSLGKTGVWEAVALPLRRDERLSDGAVLGDSLIVLTRDRVLLSTDEGANWEELELAAGNDWDGRFSLFRYLWMLHSGQMWGIPGKVIVDLVGLTFVFLTISGLIFWLWPKRIRRLKVRGLEVRHTAKTLAWNARWHIKIGVWAFFVLCFVVITGWCLRPPLLIPFVLTKAPGIEGSALSPSKPWADKLRALRWDPSRGWWLLSTSDGFYRVDPSLRATPIKLGDAPNVSVMGVTVLQQEPDGRWLVGSLSGMYRWDPDTHVIVDYFTGERTGNEPGAPFGKRPVAGYAANYYDGAVCNEVVYDYYDGAMRPDGALLNNADNQHEHSSMYNQPPECARMPISLWNLALEVHTGRIYNLFGAAPLIWIFLAGGLMFWLVLSGYKARPRHSRD